MLDHLGHDTCDWGDDPPAQVDAQHRRHSAQLHHSGRLCADCLLAAQNSGKVSVVDSVDVHLQTAQRVHELAERLLRVALR
jgi:hypothetical protein